MFLVGCRLRNLAVGLVIVFFMLATVFVQAAEKNIALISADQAEVLLDRYLEVYQDQSNKLTLKEIAKGGYGDKFVRNTQDIFAVSPATSTYWFRLTLKLEASPLKEGVILESVSSLESGQANRAVKRFIYLNTANLYDLSYYEPDSKDSSNFRSIITGRLQNFASREKPVLPFVFDVTLEPGKEKTIYFAVNNMHTSLIIFPISLVDEVKLVGKIGALHAVLLAYYGIMAAFFLYNMFLFIAIRQKLYFYYLCFIIGSAILTSALDGTDVVFLWPENPALALRLMIAIGPVLGCLYLLFIFESLDLHSYSDRFALMLRWLVASSVVLFVLSLTLESWLIGVLDMCQAAVVIVVDFFSIFYGLKKRAPTAINLLFAEVFLTGWALIYMAALSGVIQYTHLSKWGLHIGFLGEVLFLSFAVAKRVNIYREEQLRSQQKALESEALIEAKGAFLANVSHEIRTPLTTIIGYSGLLKESNLSESERKNYIAIINQSSSHLLQLINDILDVSKVEANKIFIENVPLKLFSLLDEVESYFRFATDKKHINFSVAIEYPLPDTIYSDPTRLKQILINLCNNAIKFTHIGSVTLKVHYQMAANQRSSSSNEAPVNRLHFSVIDTGIGMTPDQMGNLFMAFNQADSSITRRYGGTGLGLYISKELALKLGGDINVQSALNQGSTFTFWIETKKIGELVHERCNDDDRSLAGDSLTADAAKPDLIAPRILLAEDNVDNQKLILLYLRRMNAKVTVVQNGQQALAKANNNDYDLILMDVQMPVMDGLEATQAIRKKGVLIPIFALTANTQADEVQRCFAAGCTGHVAKPVDIEILKAVVLKKH